MKTEIQKLYERYGRQVEAMKADYEQAVQFVQNDLEDRKVHRGTITISALKTMVTLATQIKAFEGFMDDLEFLMDQEAK